MYTTFDSDFGLHCGQNDSPCSSQSKPACQLVSSMCKPPLEVLSDQGEQFLTPHCFSQPTLPFEVKQFRKRTGLRWVDWLLHRTREHHVENVRAKDLISSTAFASECEFDKC